MRCPSIQIGKSFTSSPPIHTLRTCSGSARRPIRSSGFFARARKSASYPAWSCPLFGACGPRVSGPVAVAASMAWSGFIPASTRWPTSWPLSPQPAGPPADVKMSDPVAIRTPLRIAIRNAFWCCSLIATALRYAYSAIPPSFPTRTSRSMMNRVGTRIASRASIRSAASSSRNVPCSIVRHPARSAAMIPGLPWQWAATTRSARAASPTIASSSSRENCAWTGWSSSLATPPDARTLMTLAPIRSCIRTPFRHSGTPSQRYEKPVRRNTSWMKSSGNIPDGCAGGRGRAFDRTRICDRRAVDDQRGVPDRFSASRDEDVRFDPQHRVRNRGTAEERSGGARYREPYRSVPVPAAMAGFAPPEVGRALDARFPEALEYTRRLLRQPSVSATGEGIRECSELVRQMMADIGCKTRTWAKGGHPLVIGELDVGAPVTLIVYEMYDVQPVGDLNVWQAPPFAAEIRDVPGVGQAIIGRGSTNSKGALANHLFTWKTIRDVDEMPVNLKILAEGEEEISSANFIAYIRTHRRELKADAAIANDYSEDLRGVPTIYLGVKGCLYLTVWSRGNPQAGGPMDSEIHSSNAVWIGSPVWRLLQA